MQNFIIHFHNMHELLTKILGKDLKNNFLFVGSVFSTDIRSVQIHNANAILGTKPHFSVSLYSPFGPPHWQHLVALTRG